MMKHDREVYEKYISDLEGLLKQNNINYDKYKKDNNNNGHEQNHHNGYNHQRGDIYAQSDNNQDPQFIIRKLRMR